MNFACLVLPSTGVRVIYRGAKRGVRAGRKIYLGGVTGSWEKLKSGKSGDARIVGNRGKTDVIG